MKQGSHKTINRAVLRLTGFYIAAIAILSISFSVLVYELSSNELQRPAGPMISMGQFYSSVDSDDLDTYLMNRADIGLNNLKHNLIVINLVIIMAGSALSYWFARRTLRPVDEAIRQQGRFTADASHELRTPLTVMQSEIEVNLRNKSLTLKQAKELLQSNLEEVERLGGLANGLLKLTRSDAESQAPQEIVSLRDISDQALRHVGAALTKKQASVHNNIGSAARVKGDVQSLTELLTILVGNAVKHNEPGLTIALDALSDGQHIRLVVRDNGKGIEPRDIPHIFDRFYRADSSRTRKEGDAESGYGLGLSIAKLIAEAHHGSIEVSSEPGRGCSFIVKLPAA